MAYIDSTGLKKLLTKLRDHIMGVITETNTDNLCVKNDIMNVQLEENDKYQYVILSGGNATSPKYN